MSAFGQKFGELVREKRGIEGLTQEALADLADLRGATVADIENGKSANPRQKTIDALSVALNITRDEIAACREGVTLRQTPPKPDTPTYSNLPDVPATLFHGRDEYLAQLKAVLEGGDAAITQSLQGLGGVGKTTLAIHYARLPEVAARFPIRWWVVAETEQGLEAGFAALGRTVGVAEMQEPDSVAAQKALTWLRAAPRGALILYDNAEDGALLTKWLPGDAASALVTTRIGGMAGLTEISLEIWLDDVASAYLMERTRQEDADAAMKLAQALGGLPLACEQAAAYVVETGETLAGYQARFEANPKRMVGKKATGAAHENTVATTFALAIEKATADCAAAPVVLSVMAELSDAPLPIAVFGHVNAPIGLRIGEDAAEAVDALVRWSLARRISICDTRFNVWTSCVETHRLIRLICSSGEKNDAEIAGRALGGAFPGPDQRPESNVNCWPLCSLLTDHTLQLAERINLERLHPEDPINFSRALNQAADYLMSSVGDYEKARDLFQIALLVSEACLDTDHPDISIFLSNLANVLGILGGASNLMAAKIALERALKIEVGIRGENHPNVATHLSNLAAVLQDIGGFENLLEARTALERSLQIDVALLGPKHPNVATRLSNLANLLGVLGGEENLHLAQAAMAQALEIDTNLYSSQHPIVGLRYVNMASLLASQNERSSALDHAIMAREILLTTLGVDHPHFKIAEHWVSILRK